MPHAQPAPWSSYVRPTPVWKLSTSPGSDGIVATTPSKPPARYVGMVSSSNTATASGDNQKRSVVASYSICATHA